MKGKKGMLYFKFNIKGEKGSEVIFVGRKRRVFFVKRNGKKFFPLAATTSFTFNGQKRIAKHNEIIDADGLLVFVNAKNNLAVPTLTLESSYEVTSNKFVNGLRIWLPLALGFVIGYAIGYFAVQFFFN